jgi:hypothetical protein
MKATPRQRWLIIAHAFNMDGRAASQTITDKLPHLRNAGIDAVVLSGVSGTHDTAVEHHQLWPMGPAGFRFELRHVLKRRWGSGVLYRTVMAATSIFLMPWMLLEKMFRPVESSWSWWLSAYLKGKMLARQKSFDLIYSTGGAFSAHLAARALKKSTGTRWLAEVHDPLVVPGEMPITAQQKMQAKVERLICTDADVAIWFTDQALASARQRNPQLGDRGKMMLPGIDRPFGVLPPYIPGQKFIIGHFGSLSPTRHLGPILSALEVLGQSRPDLIALTELHVYGGPLDSISAALLATSSVAHCVHHFGRIEANVQTGQSGREQILHRMRAADVLLLLHGEDAICSEYIPSKLYEYLWMQRPILALVHRNPQMTDLIRGQGHVVVESGDSGFDRDRSDHPLALALEGMFNRWHDIGLPDRGTCSEYTTEGAVKHLLKYVGSME